MSLMPRVVNAACVDRCGDNVALLVALSNDAIRIVWHYAPKIKEILFHVVCVHLCDYIS